MQCFLSASSVVEHSSSRGEESEELQGHKQGTAETQVPRPSELLFYRSAPTFLLVTAFPFPPPLFCFLGSHSLCR